jgi:hypothetical protein
MRCRPGGKVIVVRNVVRNDVRSDDGWINTHFRSFNQPVRIAVDERRPFFQ